MIGTTTMTKLAQIFLSLVVAGTIVGLPLALPADTDQNTMNLPTVVVAFLVRNKEHTLPYFLGCLEKLAYPKSKLTLFIRSDHNVDKSVDMLQRWISRSRHLYGGVNSFLDTETRVYEEEERVKDWVDERFDKVIELREEALNFARKIDSDYILFVDSDNFLHNENALQLLMSYKKTLIAPMMDSYHPYSNWWCNVTEDGLRYRKNSDTDLIHGREKVGVFPVSVVHSTFLIHLRQKESDFLSFLPDPLTYKGHLDDVVIFNMNARRHGVGIWLTNEEEVGILPAPWYPPNNLEYESWRHLILHMEHLLANHSPIPISPIIAESFDLHPPSTRLSGLFDGIFVINLRHRPNRRRRLEHVFREWGIEAEFLDAVDGRNVTSRDVDRLGMRKLKEFKCPFTGRDLTYGEIGCFLSHWHAWKEAERRGLKRVWIMEDDVSFERDFRQRVKAAMKELGVLTKEEEEEEERKKKKLKNKGDREEKEDDNSSHSSSASVPPMKWDLLYFSKRKITSAGEQSLENSKYWLWPENSFWALSYVLSDTGVRKLLDSRPLEKLLPVDLIFPILYDKYSNEDIKRHFEPRDLVALSLQHHVCNPAKYRGQKHYSSDTDSKNIIPKGFILDYENPKFQNERNLLDVDTILHADDEL